MDPPLPPVWTRSMEPISSCRYEPKLGKGSYPYQNQPEGVCITIFRLYFVLCYYSSIPLLDNYISLLVFIDSLTVSVTLKFYGMNSKNSLTVGGFDMTWILPDTTGKRGNRRLIWSLCLLLPFTLSVIGHPINFRRNG